MSPAHKIEVNKDTDNDVLYVMHSDYDPNDTVNVDVTADVVVRLDRKTGKVVGFIIDDFSRINPSWAHLKDYELMERFEKFIEMMNDLHLAPSKP